MQVPSPLAPRFLRAVGWLHCLPRATAEIWTFELEALAARNYSQLTGCQREWEAAGTGWSVHIPVITKIPPRCCQEEAFAAGDSSLLATSVESYCTFTSAVWTDEPVPSLSGCSSART